MRSATLKHAFTMKDMGLDVRLEMATGGSSEYNCDRQQFYLGYYAVGRC